jgi:hypothetical protein
MVTPPAPSALSADTLGIAVAEKVATVDVTARRQPVQEGDALCDTLTRRSSAQQGKRDYDKAFPLFLVAGKHGHAAGSFSPAVLQALSCAEGAGGVTMLAGDEEKRERLVVVGASPS